MQVAKMVKKEGFPATSYISIVYVKVCNRKKARYDDLPMVFASHAGLHRLVKDVDPGAVAPTLKEDFSYLLAKAAKNDLPSDCETTSVGGTAL